MEQGLALLLPLFLGLLQPGHGGRLEVEPPEPEVAVAVGESRQFACRLACADGQVASVQWRGLDTSLGSVKSGTGSSVLWVHNASLSAAGTRMCVGYCGKRSFHHTVNLLVFAFPDQLTVSPESLVPGRDREVACTAHNVSPARPDVFSMSLLLGDQELEGVQTLDRDVMEEPQEDEDPLFQVTERWLLPPLGIPAPPTLHCQVTMSLPGLNRSHRQSIPVLQGLTSPEPCVTTSLESPITTSPETPEQTSTHSPRSPDPEPGNSSTRPCHPEIHQVSALGTLELLCEAACGPGVAVHWTQAPGGLAAYKTREAGAQAWLTSGSTLWTECHPEGWFQCRLDPGGQMANLYLVPEICSLPASAALWTGSLVLGLLLLVFLIYRLWKRCRPTS
ncbi:mucosal addressin cell adhesion molecule 1 precursor [Sus scrofa]|uniref:Mucosal addressin cell adhesion molecule 1 n=2 Tax=Sus scrofa TaxID=9823 RepID=A0A4X1VWL9_PIG|nr:mucosal addressin cell adhesion molecule 1 precursor [Sus scrofa]ABB89993.1 mucosal addressin cellular adhesion molecule-1 [Sus scrofa]